ncbi:PREDICTED: protein toll-like isoform X2 [Papilio xuthus]|nr:PREDICTED: protein toll-like isoform X2 [Papilio xuthus]XP_013165520.1 PREDICTED: protein toll-like isoform X2 [Papilio xuthus]XP_013165521.1 PREDICTED: protein toll-like isoform X2 [Papilio xuthus]XP_013165522.1 PREDICTED: protein toll-like isoform X2 [Papilio xuthus]XP_013165523.1 PREDICTED: protein toll-like isoform X2 [Papilio xuthus]XP_013165524.1 PREDICTED: protein toll-like isoform X2 [Papilio xuthus]
MATALVVLLAVAAAASPAPSAPPLDVTTLLEDMTYEVTMTTLLPENDTVVEISTIAADDNIGSTSVSLAGQRGDGEWRCPRGCECAALAEGTSYNCSLPSGVLAFDEYGDGITFKCQSGVFRCAELPLAASAGRLGRGALQPALGSVTLRGCALPAEPVTCALSRRGGRNTTKLIVQAPRTPLDPVHLRGLENLEMLRITDLEGAPTELPLRALGAVPRLRQLMLNEAQLQLHEPLPALPLLALELAADSLAALPPQAFRALPTLRRLGLWANALADLPEDTFEGLEELRELSLSQNRLTSLPGALLKRTPRLERLDLYANRLRTLPAALLAGLRHLVQVRLMDNAGGLTLEPRAFAELPALRELDLSRSALHEVPGDAMAGARELRVLRLAGCKLRRLPPALLAGLARLETLDLSGNLLADLPRGLFSDLQNLNELNLDDNMLTTLPSSCFLGLRNMDTLSLNRNRLAEIAVDAFVGVRQLQRLSLSHNLLALGASERDGESGEYNPLGTPPSAFSALPSLRRLDLSHNRVAALLDDWRLVLVSLQRLDLSWNTIALLDYTNLNFLSSGVTVDLRHNNISTVLLLGPTDGSAVFLLDDNPFQCDCHTPALRQALATPAQGGGVQLVAPAALCAAPSELAGRPLLDVPDDRLACPLPAPPCPRGCTCLLLPRALRLDCGPLPARLPDPTTHGVDHIELRLRDAPSDLSSLPGVRALDLARLNLTQLPAIAPGVEVDLTGNRLSRVPAELLAHNKLRLAGNPLACDCEHVADVLALQRAGDSRLQNYGALRCADGSALIDVHTDKLCLERNAIVLAVTLLIVAFAVVWFCYLLHRLGHGVPYWVLGCGCCSPEDEDDLGKKYHAFVSFAHEDTALAEEMVAALEAPPHSLRLCVHYRDWTLGDWIPEQIATSVESSRRTVIVLSRAFLSSYWGLIEFREAHRRAMTDGKARVMAVLVGDVLQDPRLGDELRTYLATTTYLHRDDVRFLPKLASALRPRRSLLQALRRTARPAPTSPAPLAPTSHAPPAPPAVDKLIGIALEGKLTQEGKLINAAFTAPSL